MRASWWPVLVWAALISGALWLTATRLSVHSELGDLLPEGSTPTQRLLLTQVRSGLAGRLMLLAIEGSQQDELARFSKALGEGLRAHPQIAFVGNGTEGLSSEERQVLFRSRYLLSHTLNADTFSRDSLHAALEQRLDDLRSPLAPMIKEYIPADPTAEFLGILQSWSGWEAPAMHRGVWMSADRHRALLVVETSAAGFDADAQEAIQQDIRTIVSAAGRSVVTIGPVTHERPWGVCGSKSSEPSSGKRGGSRQWRPHWSSSFSTSAIDR